MSYSKYLSFLLLALALTAKTEAADLDLDGIAESGDKLGSAVATGDFNCDTFDDLAIGVPGENSPSGAVNIVYGGTGIGGRLGGPGILHLQIDYSTFGHALAAGDFDNDGCDDLAVGFPGDSLIFPEAGGVSVLYGDTPGIHQNSVRQYWTQNSPSIDGAAEAGDKFGYSLAVGDFDNDGYDDLAIGAPGEGVSTAAYAGSVNVIYGNTTGLNAAGDQFYHQDTAGIPDAPEQGLNTEIFKGDNFGYSLAAGDFDGNGYDDLAIGIPGETFTSYAEGAVQVLYSYDSSGISTTNNEFWHQDVNSVLSQRQPREYFGYALAAGDFTRDGRDDLAIGVPMDYSAALQPIGSVNVLHGTTDGGLTAEGDQLWNRLTPGMQGTAEALQYFGAALAVADFNGDGGGDLAIGVPRERASNSVLHSGGIHIIFAAAGGGLTDIVNQYFHQDLPNVPESREFGDEFAFAIAAGDFNQDTRHDLVVGVPNESKLNTAQAGAVEVFYGDVSYINMSDNQLLTQ
jgi:hypothetical protein